MPLHYVAEASREAVGTGSLADVGVSVHNRAKEIAVGRRCMVLGVIHDGSAHFMFPFVHPQLFNDFSGASLPAFHLNSNVSA